MELRLQIDLESAELERVGLERCDRPGLDADVDAPMGYDENWVEWCTRAVHAKNFEMPSKVQKSAMDKRKLMESELTDCSREKWSQTCDAGWHLAWSGVEWCRKAASGGWLRWR